METAISTSVAGCDLCLWRDVPDHDWLRNHGRTRVLVIDDMYTSAERLFGDRDTPDERMLRRWLNVDFTFVDMPDDYRWAAGSSTGSFTNEWFVREMRKQAADPRPIAAVLLDMMFGKEDTEESPTGLRFLSLLREHLGGAGGGLQPPVLILTQIMENPGVIGALKATGALFEDYIPKRDPSRPEQSRTERIVHKLVQWGDLSDPGLPAFSPLTRRLARALRRIALADARVHYQEREFGTFPKPVLVLGPHGAGKNFAVRHLHSQSTRAGRPMNGVTFTDLGGEEGARISLFGSAPFTGADKFYYIDPETGALLGTGKAPPKQVRPAPIALGALGVLLRSHIAGPPNPPGPGARPLLGTVLLDEVGAVSHGLQRSLLGVLNRGRFTPHNLGLEIPHRPLDLWFMFTATAEAYGKMAPDLAARLAQGDVVRIPPLSDRVEDVIPLAISFLCRNASRAAPSGDAPGAPIPTDDPDRVLSREARSWLLARSRRWQVRDLIGVLEGAASVTQKMPYNIADLESSLAQTRTHPAATPAVASAGTASRAAPPGGTSDEGSAPRSPPVPWESRERDPRAVPAGREDGPAVSGMVTDDLIGLVHILKARRLDQYQPGGPDPRQRLREQLRDVARASSKLILAYLDQAIRAIRHEDDSFATTELYRFVAGQKAVTNTARDAFFSLMFDKEAVQEAIRESDGIARLVLDLAARQKTIKDWLQELTAGDAEQAERLARLRGRPGQTGRGGAGGEPGDQTHPRAAEERGPGA